jgi:hypothetical protein
MQHRHDTTPGPAARLTDDSPALRGIGLSAAPSGLVRREPRRARPVEVDAPIIGILRTIHASWLQEVRGVLNPARSADAGVWVRWTANRYIQTDLAHRLDLEREAITAARGLLTGDRQTHLWALGELLDSLRRYLDQAVGICQRAEEFSTVMLKLLRALGHWCDGVEDAVGQARWSDLPPASRRVFKALSQEASADGA